MKKLIAVLLLLTIVSGSVFAESLLEKSSTIPFVLNLVVGFGVGSYVQGDITGGVIGTVGELVPLAVVVASSLKMASDIAANPNLTTEDIFEVEKKAALVSTISSLTLVGVRIFECIRPFSFEKKLAENLNAKNVDFSATPVLTSASNVDFSLNCRIDF